MAKKHCDKHKYYVYKCRDCRIANGEEVPEVSATGDNADQSDEKGHSNGTERKAKKYIDADYEHLDEETFEPPSRKKISESPGGRGPPGRGRGGGGSRFKYRKPMSKERKIKMIGIGIFAAIIVAIILIYGIPVWHAQISLQQQLYDAKAGGLNYWNFYILNWWSTSFIINKVGLIGGAIGLVIMCLPPEKNVIALIGTKLGFGRPSTKKALLIVAPISFVLFYLIGQLIDGIDNNFSLVMYMIESGNIEPSIADIFLPFLYLGGSQTISLEEHIVSIFVYNNVYLPIFRFVLGVIIFRLILNIIGVAYLKRNDFLIIANIMAIISLFFAISFVSIPLNAYDGLQFIQLWSRPLGFIGFLGFAIVMAIYSRKTSHYEIDTDRLRKFALTGGIIIGCILIPLFVSIPTAITIDNATWYEDRWIAKINKQREWTTHTAGLTMFEEQPIENLIESKDVSDNDVVQSIRQYDKEAAISAMSSYALTAFESLADSDIVYIDDEEYWVAPKTIKVEQLTTDTRRHTNIFDHVEGYLAIDTFTGDLLSAGQAQTLLGVSNDYPIFFGEHESSELGSTPYSYNGDEYDFWSDVESSYGAFDDNILLNTELQNSPENYDYNYQGDPDGTLTGLEAFWFTSQMGLFSYAIDDSLKKEYLINRNINDRVGSILLPGLWIDEDPYLVFNNTGGKLYYALSICTDVPINSFSTSGVLRFLGIALVDVLTGELQFVINPALEDVTSASDPIYNLYKVYLDKYDWQSVDDDAFKNWLPAQLRYPEQLFEEQLSYQYYYHVNDPDDWFAGANFHERPTDGDTFYVEMDLGEGLEFVGIDLVQRTTTQDGGLSTLAGLYCLRHGDNFGNVTFYKAQDQMVSPSRARSSYENAATQQLALISPKDFGNILLYPLNSSLYYFVPTYAVQGELQDLQIAGFINAFNLKVGYGADAFQAYDDLNFTSIKVEENASVALEYNVDDQITLPDNATIRAFTEVVNLNASEGPYDVVVNVSVQSDLTNITVFDSAVPSSNFTWGNGYTGMNFTIIDQTLQAGEIYGVNAKFEADIGSLAWAGIIYQMVLIVDGEVIYRGPEEVLIVYNT